MATSEPRRRDRRRGERGGRARRGRGERGQALVEFLLVMPFLVAFLAGIFETVWFTSARDVVAQSARDSARIVAREGAVSSDASNVVDRTIAGGDYRVSDIRAISATITSPGGAVQTVAVPASSPLGGGTVAACVLASAQPVGSQDVTVTVTYRYHLLFPFLRSVLFLGIGNIFPRHIVQSATAPAETAWIGGISGPTLQTGTATLCP